MVNEALSDFWIYRSYTNKLIYLSIYGQLSWQQSTAHSYTELAISSLELPVPTALIQCGPRKSHPTFKRYNFFNFESTNINVKQIYLRSQKV